MSNRGSEGEGMANRGGGVRVRANVGTLRGRVIHSLDSFSRFKESTEIWKKWIICVFDEIGKDNNIVAGKLQVAN